MALADYNTAHFHDVAVIRPMTDADVEFAASLHQTALDHGFFPRLGTGFLAEYYRAFVTSPRAVAFVAEAAGGPVGVLVGVVKPSHGAWTVRHHGWSLLRRAVAAMVRHPDALWFFLRRRALWYLGAGGRAALSALIGRRGGPTPAEPCTAVLMHVAVASAARGTGAGTALVDAFLTAAREQGCADAMLVTLAGRDGAGRFYRRLGWTLRDLRPDRDGRLHECYERRL